MYSLVKRRHADESDDGHKIMSIPRTDLRSRWAKKEITTLIYCTNE